MTLSIGRTDWPRTAGDSLVARMTRGGRRSSAFWMFGANLVWLFWMVAAPWFVGPPTAFVLWSTFGSIAVFLAFYQRAWFGRRAMLPWYTLGIALLGLAIIPVNSSWSYIIYAGSLLPFFARGWRLVARMTLLLAAFYVVAIASGFYSPLLTVSCIVTTILVAFFNGVFDFNAERDATLRLTQDEVRRLAVAAERERIGRDLHDLLGHTLSLIVIKTSLARRLVEADAGAALAELAEIERVARQSLAEVREAVTGMRTTALAGEIASARLMLEAADIDLRLTTAAVEAGDGPRVAPDCEAALAFGLREAVTNVQRHAGATRVEVDLRPDAESFELTVRDNGRGGIASYGNGLSGMRERLAVLGGSLELESTPGEGTLLRMRVPRSPAVAAPVAAMAAAIPAARAA